MERVIFGAKPGEPVPTVNPEDMKSLWLRIRDMKARFPGESVGIAGWEHSLSPGANAEAVRHRISMLQLVLRNVQPLQLNDVLAPFLNDGEPTDAMFRAMAEVSMKGVREEEIYHGFPFDFAEFLSKLSASSTGGNP